MYQYAQYKFVINGAGATLMTYSLDGWSTRRMASLCAHMVITAARKAHFIRSEDMSSLRHTAETMAGENFLQLAFSDADCVC